MLAQMGNIIYRQKPALVVPIVHNFSAGGFRHALEVFNDVKMKGGRLYPVVTRSIDGVGQVVVDGLKRAVIGYVDGLDLRLFVARHKFDMINYKDFLDVPKESIWGMNVGIEKRFDKVEGDLDITRESGIRNMNDLVMKNAEMIKDAYRRVLGKEINLASVVA